MVVFQGQILKNTLSNGQTILVQVLAAPCEKLSGMARVCDAREPAMPLSWLINKNKTWACPVENLLEDAETKKLTDAKLTPMPHEHALIHWAF